MVYYFFKKNRNKKEIKRTTARKKYQKLVFTMKKKWKRAIDQLI